MHGGSWRAGSHREGRDDQQISGARLALEMLITDPNCSKDAHGVFLASDSEALCLQIGWRLIFEFVHLKYHRLS